MYGTSQIQPKISLTGIEYYTGTNTNGDGIGLLLGINRTENRQLWICDTAQTAINTTNTVLRIIVDHPIAHGLTNHILQPSPEPELRSPGAPGKAVRRRCGIVPVSPTGTTQSFPIIFWIGMT